MVKLAVVMGAPIALLATVASLGVVVVDVKEGGPHGHHVVVPVPLVLAQAALAVAPALAPPDKLRLHEGEALEHVDVARDVIDALAKAPDGELVRVEERDELVVISKQGRTLHVSVHGRRGEDVDVNVPLHFVLQALPDRHGRIHTAALAASLGGVRFTDLVHVRDGRDEVRVWVW
jgi:hypothetical protein